MKFGIVPINLGEFTDPQVVIPFVQKAERLGYESVWTAEHVIIPKHYDSVYPYNPSGKVAVSARCLNHRPAGRPDLYRRSNQPSAARHRGQYFAPDQSSVSGQMGPRRSITCPRGV